tara:strand:- start:8227 stop:9003 length:777 start_codon:yes stop_codon:yes gene_type:complete
MKNQRIRDLFNFEKKIVLITGSSGQLGECFSKLFLDLGAIVFGFDKKINSIKHKNFSFILTDISNKNSVQKNIDLIVKKNKRVDIIINNAGYSVFTKYLSRTNLELDKTVDANLKGAIHIINSYVKVHKKKKLKKCKIINIGSIYGSMSPDFRVYGKEDNYNSEIYGATKAALIQITKYYSVILSNFNINVNCLSPGGIYNEKKPQSKSFVKKYSLRIPKKRMAKNEDFNTGILFLASDKSDYVTGQNLIIDGGLSAW